MFNSHCNFRLFEGFAFAREGTKDGEWFFLEALLVNGLVCELPNLFSRSLKLAVLGSFIFSWMIVIIQAEGHSITLSDVSTAKHLDIATLRSKFLPSSLPLLHKNTTSYIEDDLYARSNTRRESPKVLLILACRRITLSNHITLFPVGELYVIMDEVMWK